LSGHGSAPYCSGGSYDFTFTWITTNADSVTANGRGLPASGNVTLSFPCVVGTYREDAVEFIAYGPGGETPDLIHAEYSP